MSSLTSEPISSTLEKLFIHSSKVSNPALESMSLEEQQRLLNSKTAYRELYGDLLKELWLPISPETGHLLFMLTRSTNARNVVEFGTSFGISTIFFAAALKDNGGGKIITTEFEPEKVKQAHRHFKECGVSELIELREGDALQTLSANIPETVDILLLDGAKALYNDILALLETSLIPGSIVIADNADMNPEYLSYIREKANGFISIPFADDVELSMKIV
ncbi:Putative O-methyltransferase/MSMEI_4947 [Thalassocella blandensis]|nr:Putative O-methyltransferase/MSMEI_4947 [Thalassocella blandensis]